jgi:hypothetical protein
MSFVTKGANFVDRHFSLTDKSPTLVSVVAHNETSATKVKSKEFDIFLDSLALEKLANDYDNRAVTNGKMNWIVTVQLYHQLESTYSSDPTSCLALISDVREYVAEYRKDYPKQKWTIVYVDPFGIDYSLSSSQIEAFKMLEKLLKK